MATTFNNTVYQAGFAGTDDGAPSATFQIDDASRNPLTVNGTVAQPDDPITVTGILPGDTTSSTTTFYATQFDNPSMIQFSDAPGGTGSTRLILSNSQVFGTGSPNRTRFTSDGDTSLNSYAAPVCFTTGTLIRTVRGDVSVEELAVGDLAVTTSGEHRPIRWIGHRHLEASHHGGQPITLVRITAAALGSNRPCRDLVVTPAHAIALDLLGEVLIPARCLVNGATILEEEVDSVTVWHVELESHDLLLAEGQAAESFLDMGNRRGFAGGTVVDLVCEPDGDPSLRTHADFCRPYHEGGALVAFVREHLQARAKAQGWRLSSAEPWAGVHVIADGVRIAPEVRGTAARFALPVGSRDLWLIAPAVSPNELGMSSDGRQLGLRLTGLRVGDGWDAREVALNDPLLGTGFHEVEGEAGQLRRWTAGRAQLPASLWSDEDRTLVMRLDEANPNLPRWIGPEAAEAMAISYEPLSNVA